MDTTKAIKLSCFDSHTIQVPNVFAVPNLTADEHAFAYQAQDFMKYYKDKVVQIRIQVQNNPFQNDIVPVQDIDDVTFLNIDRDSMYYELFHDTKPFLWSDEFTLNDL